MTEAYLSQICIGDFIDSNSSISFELVDDATDLTLKYL